MLVLKQLPSLIVFRLEFSLFLQSDVFYSPRILVLINVKSSEVLRHGDAPLFCSMRRHSSIKEAFFVLCVSYLTEAGTKI